MMQQINMPGLLRENCVLQRGDHTRVWGWYEKDDRDYSRISTT